MWGLGEGVEREEQRAFRGCGLKAPGLEPPRWRPLGPQLLWGWGWGWCQPLTPGPALTLHLLPGGRAMATASLSASSPSWGFSLPFPIHRLWLQVLGLKHARAGGPGRRAPSPAPQLSQSLARIGFRKQAGGAWQAEGHVRGLGHRSQSPEPGPLNRALEMRAVGTAGAEPLLARPCCLFPPGTDASLCHGVLVPFTDGKAEAQGGWGVTRPLTHSRQEAELRCEPSSV